MKSNSNNKHEQDAQENQHKVEETQENEELQFCKQELAQWKDQATRIFADFDNYKKRTEREQSQWMEVAQATILKDIISFVDDFDRALSQKTDDTKDLYAGMEMVHKSLMKLLEKYGVKEFTSYDHFDPELHEALMNVESDKHESGQIVQVLEKGFMHKDVVLRPAKVSVAK
jgi:molecular chaperone GrpE